MTKAIIAACVSVVLTLILMFEIMHIIKTSKEEKPSDPFKKIGVIATKNGLVGELFKVEDCYILVSTYPMEQSRGIFQMECK